MAERLNGAPRALVRGMFVRVILHTAPKVDLVKLPLEALRPGDKVWLANDGNLRIVPVQVAQVLRDGVLLNSADVAVKTGDRVVISPLPAVADGMEVLEKTDQELVTSS